MLELKPTIDLTSTTTAMRPIMYFWTRYTVNNSPDNIRVEIAQQDATSPVNNYNKIGGWQAWTAQPIMAGVPVPVTQISNEDMVTWLQGQVDLSPYIGQKIRVRFVANVPDNTAQADGIYLDDITFTFGPSQISLTSSNFVDPAQNTGYWVTEGTWGIGLDAYVGTGAGSADLGSGAWSGTYFDCNGCSINGFANVLKNNSNYLPTDPYIITGPKIGPEPPITDVLYNWGDTLRPLGTADTNYDDTFAARWNRVVTLTPGTYQFRTISDDGVRLRIDDITGTDITLDPLRTDGSGLIIDDWGNHPATLDYGVLTVSTPITRMLSLEFYENTGQAQIELYATSSSYSFTDSPNTPSGAGFTTVKSLFPGNSSLMLNGFFDLSTAPNRTLSYQRLYDLKAANTFYVEYSTNGGFNWTAFGSETLSNATRTIASGWQQRGPAGLTLPAQPNVMIRFRLDTRAATGGSK